MVTTKSVTMRRLAQIADNSPGYTAAVHSGDMVTIFSNISFERNKNGRRNKSVVLADYTANGVARMGRFDASLIVEISD